MFSIKKCKTRRNRGIALLLLGVSFAIQMVPPMLHKWAEVGGVNEGTAMAVIAGIYLLLIVYAMRKGRSGES